MYPCTNENNGDYGVVAISERANTKERMRKPNSSGSV